MRKLVLVTLALAMIASLSMGAVSAGWYGDVSIDGQAVSSTRYYGSASGTKYLSSYTGHALVEIGYLDGSGYNIGMITVSSETYNHPYSGSVYFYADKNGAGNCAYCLSEVTGSDGRTYTQNTYH